MARKYDMSKAEKSVLNRIQSGVYTYKAFVGRTSSMYKFFLAVFDENNRQLPNHFYCHQCAEVRIKDSLKCGTNQFLRHITNFHGDQCSDDDDNDDDSKDVASEKEDAGVKNQKSLPRGKVQPIIKIKRTVNNVDSKTEDAEVIIQKSLTRRKVQPNKNIKRTVKNENTITITKEQLEEAFAKTQNMPSTSYKGFADLIFKKMVETNKCKLLHSVFRNISEKIKICYFNLQQAKVKPKKPFETELNHQKAIQKAVVAKSIIA